MFRPLLPALLVCASLSAQPAPELADQFALFGSDFLVREIPAPVLESPAAWVNRDDGAYHYLYTAGDDQGKKEQLERHRYDDPATARSWKRQIGASYVEWFEIEDAQGVRFLGETDLRHGFQVKITPGITIPAGTKAGETWQTDNALEAERMTEPGKIAYQGRLHARCRYVGAYRVKVPAGEFDTVLIEQRLTFNIGRLNANDTRLLFYAQGLGVIAEVESLRASALVVIHVTEKSAKVLTRPGRNANTP